MRTLLSTLPLLFILSRGLYAVITPGSVTAGTEGLIFPKVVFTTDQVTTGNPSIRWKVIGAPPGMGIDNRGNYAGTPTKAGNYSMVVYAYTANGSRLVLRDSRTVAHSINATLPPTINGPFTLPDRAKFDVRFKGTGGHQLTASGGYPHPANSSFPLGYSWELVPSGSGFQTLPAGMSISRTGVVSGTPSARSPIPWSVQTYVFRAKATDFVGKSATANFTLVVDPADPPSILSQCPLPDGLEQTVYKNHTLVGIGGKPPYHWTIIPSSSFPPGLKVDHRTGVISGRPTTSGNFTFTINLRDANGLSDNKSCAITIHPIPHITTNSIVEWDCATPGKNLHCATITAIGGNPPYKWEIIPPVENLTITTLPPNQARICGNFTSAGVKQVTVKVTDEKTSKFTMKTFTVPVYPPLQITTQCPLPTGKTGEDYSASFTAIGGKPPYTWEILPQIYVADFFNCRIRKFSEDGIMTTFAGNGVNLSIDGPRANSSFNNPYGMAFDSQGNIYVADRKKIRKIDFQGNVSTLNGTFNGPEDMVADEIGNVFVADVGPPSIIKKIDFVSGVVSNLAGGSVGFLDKPPGPSALFNHLQGICWDLQNNMLVTDMNNHAIRKIDINGLVTTISGGPLLKGYFDGPVNTAQFNGPHDVKVHQDGTIYVLDHYNGCIRKISKNGIVSTLGGKSNLTNPYCLSVDKNGFVYVSDGATNHNISKISPTGQIKVIAGSNGPSAGAFVDNTHPLQARFNGPRGVEINPYEDLPSGLILNSTTGEITGNPEAYGSYNLTYRVTDACGNTAISTCTLSINSTEKSLFNDPNGKIIGNVYMMPTNSNALFTRAQLEGMQPITSVKMSNIDIPLQSFSKGFPGHGNLTEWFQIKFDGFLEIPQAGQYEIKLGSDDGSKFRIFDVNSNTPLLELEGGGLNNDENVSPQTSLLPKVYRFELDYYQGPRFNLGLRLSWRKPNDQSFEIIPASNFVNPPSN